MRKLLISIFLVSLLMGAALPAMANPQTNNADIHQNQVAVPVSIGNTAIGGGIFGGGASAGNQNIFQNQHASICQGNIKSASDDGIAFSPFSGNNNRVCKDP